MKLKYKKIILLTTMSTMGIGLLTLSISHDKTEAQESLSKNVTAEAMAEEVTSPAEKSVNTLMDVQTTPIVSTAPSVTAAPTSLPTPAPLPVYKIEKEGTYPEIDQLMQDYYTAKNNRDLKTLKTLLSDPSQADSQEDLQKKTEYIEEYRNIKTYTKKGFKEGTYIVYVYHEIKFTSINTPAPGLAQFYIITDADNKLKIFSGTKDPETQAYYDQRNEDEDVAALIEMTNEKGKKAIKEDEDLLNFWKSIDEMANSNGTDAAEGDGN